MTEDSRIFGVTAMKKRSDMWFNLARIIGSFCLAVVVFGCFPAILFTPEPVAKVFLGILILGSILLICAGWDSDTKLTERIQITGVVCLVFAVFGSLLIMFILVDTGAGFTVAISFSALGAILLIYARWRSKKEDKIKQAEKEKEQKAMWRQWEAERLQAADELKRKELREIAAFEEGFERSVRDWRELELFPVGNEQSGVFSAYQVEMTDAEIDLIQPIADRFDPYCIFVDTYLRKEDGKTTQIDIIVICNQGIIVIESKGYKGWIYGEGDDQEWTQVLAGGNEDYQFYNPIRQNNLHAKVLRKELCSSFLSSCTEDILRRTHFFSLIVFDDEANLDNIAFLPKNHYVLKARRLGDVLDEISSNDAIFSDGEVMKIAYVIRRQRVIPDQTVRESHIQGIKETLGIDRVFQ
jgi:hypothetical protein